MDRKKETKLHHGLITLIITMIIMFVLVVGFKASPHIPLILGCTVAGLMAKYLGYSWEEILEGMIQGIVPSLEAMIILTLIGVLIATWIAAGTVPAMIFYGLKLISARFFIVAVMIICSLIALAVGSWGTVGTVGLAFIGIGAVLQINPALTAGAIVSGAYMGEAVSPLSDATNLVAAVGRKPIMEVVAHELKLIMPAYIIAGIIFAVVGIKNAPADTTAIADNVDPLLGSLSENFYISPIVLMPMILMVACIVIKIPAIPSILVGIIAAIIQAVLLQNSDFSQLINSCYGGYISQTGSEMLDELLSAGGIIDMMYAITVILTAMSFGGIMQSSHQMGAVIAPVVSKIKTGGGMVRVTIVSCILMNIILPDQYLGISIPGQMYGEEFEKRGVDRLFLTDTLCCGATVTSPLIPWNTCGAYMMTVLGVSAAQYFQYAYFNIIAILMVLVFGAAMASKK